MNCTKWKGIIPQAVMSCRYRDAFRCYEGCVVAICGECQYACIWEKGAWVGRTAKDFTRRKISIGKLKNSIREIENPEPVFVKIEG